jgi:hypothetical protein
MEANSDSDNQQRSGLNVFQIYFIAYVDILYVRTNTCIYKYIRINIIMHTIKQHN